MCVNIIWLQFYCSLEAFDALIHSANVLVEVSQVIVRHVVLRLQGDGALVVFLCLRQLTHFLQCTAKIVVCVYVCGVQRDRLAVACDSLVDLSALLQRTTQVVVCERPIGVQG